MTKPKRYQRYSAEFKREAIRRAAEEGITDKKVCDELGISTRQFRRWRDELHVLGSDAFPGKGHSRDEELTALKRELAQVKKERDFLKEAAAYFAKEGPECARCCRSPSGASRLSVPQVSTGDSETDQR